MSNRAKLYEKAVLLPLLPGVYIMRDRSGRVIYVGKAKRLRTRVSQYFREGRPHEAKVTKMVESVHDFDVIVTDSEYEALVLECSQIKQYAPKYNILLKDDKGFSYIRISKEPYPRITGELQKKDDGAQYIGPYLNSFAVRGMVETANEIFGIPTCKRRFPRDIGKGRPCLNAHIGRCMAVCSGKISREEYLEAVDRAVTMLTHGTDAILEKLETDMMRASEALEFERAARIRDSIQAIRKLADGQKVVKEGGGLEADVFAFAGSEDRICAVVFRFRGGRLTEKDEHILPGAGDLSQAREEFVSHYYIHRNCPPPLLILDKAIPSAALVSRMLTEKKGTTVKIVVPQKGERQRLVEMAYKNAAERLKRDGDRKTRDENSLGELANLLGMSDAPERIEAYDISNYGEEAVAGMTVFVDGKPRKSDYRKFKIKTVAGVDDYASMTEVLTRRAARLESKSAGFSKKPDLILLDGGKGHVATIRRMLKNSALCGVPIFGMVKDEKHRTRTLVGEDGEAELSMFRGAYTLVSKIQEETHRFAVEFQRASHSKNSLQSSLLKVEGIGEKRAAALLKHFKTMKAIREASIEDLAAVEGMTERAAKALWEALRLDKK